jgi:hypothetical protein
MNAPRYPHRFSPARSLLVGVCCALLAWIALSNPLFHSSTHVPGRPVTDYYHFHWNYWWMRHALTHNLPIYETTYVMSPETTSLALHTLTPFWFPLWALAEPFVGTAAAMNLICLVSMTLAGVLFYRLLRQEGVSPGLALVGGVMLELSPLMFNGIFWTNINLMGWFWLPALMLMLDRLAHAAEVGRLFERLWWALMIGAGLWALVLIDLQYPLLSVWLLLPYGLRAVWRIRSARGRLTLLMWSAVALLVGLALLWWAGPLPHILAYDRGNLSPTPAERAVSLDFPLAYIWHVEGDAAPVSLGAVVLPLLLIALIMSLRVRGAARRWFWLALVPLPLVLSAGYALTVGDVSIPLPYGWLHNLLGGMFRYPERFAPVILIPAVTFAMQALTPALRHQPALIVALLLLVIADSRLLRPFPIQPLPTPYTFYERMRAEPHDYVVVEVPTGASSGEGIVGEAVYSTLQFYGTTHGKRMINGHFSRVDIQHYWYLRTDDPLLSWLGQRRFLEPDAARARLEDIIDDYPVGYFVVHTDLIERYTGKSTVIEVLGWLNSLPALLCPVWVEGSAVVYRTTWHPDGCPARTPPENEPDVYRIDIGGGDLPHIGWGWHYPEQIGGLSARWLGRFETTQLYLALPPGAYELALAAQSFVEERTFQVSLNGEQVGSATAAPDSLTEFRFAVPADRVGNGTPLTLTFTYDPAQSPAALGRSDDDRPLALLVDWVQFRRIESQ